MREKTTPTRTTAATKTATRRRKRNTTTPRTTAPAWQLVYVSWLVHWYFCYAIPTGPLWFVNAAGASTFSSLNLKESHRRRAASHSYSPTEICENLRSKRYKQQAATGQHLKANREAQQCHTSCFIITNHISSQAGAQSKIKVIYSNHQSDASSICAGGALLHCFTHFILHSADMHCIIIQKNSSFQTVVLLKCLYIYNIYLVLCNWHAYITWKRKLDADWLLQFWLNGLKHISNAAAATQLFAIRCRAACPGHVQSRTSREFGTLGAWGNFHVLWRSREIFRSHRRFPKHYPSSILSKWIKIIPLKSQKDDLLLIEGKLTVSGKGRIASFKRTLKNHVVLPVLCNLRKSIAAAECHVISVWAAVPLGNSNCYTCWIHSLSHWPNCS